jgi:hypothetical protein
MLFLHAVANNFNLVETDFSVDGMNEVSCKFHDGCPSDMSFSTYLETNFDLNDISYLASLRLWSAWANNRGVTCFNM